MQGFARRKQGSQVVSGVSIPLMSAFHTAETATHTHTHARLYSNVLGTAQATTI